MATVGERIKNAREAACLSQVELAEKIGVSKQLLYKYENNIVTNIPSDKIEQIAVLCHTMPAILMGWAMPQNATAVRIPVLGRVAAGTPIEALEDVIDYEDIPEKLARSGDYFALRIKGDSMEPRISNGDTVIVRKQEDADDGDIVIALINGNEGTCKRLKKYPDGIALVSINPAYDPMYFSGEEVSSTPVRIIGRVMELRAKF